MLKIILGRNSSGKTSLLYKKIKACAEEKKRSLLIVPEQFSHEAERELCMMCGNQIGLYAEVLSFTRLFNRVLAETGGLSDKTLDAGGRILLMDLALKTASPMLKVYKLGRHRPDFLQRLLDTRDEFKSAGADFNKILELCPDCGSLSEKLHDLSIIFDTYSSLIPKNVVDPKDRLDILSERIEKSSLSGEIYIDGFTDFTAQELSVVGKLMEKCENVTVSLNCDSIFGTEIQYELQRKTVGELLALSNRLCVKSELTELPDIAPEDALSYAKRYVFSDEKPKYEGNCDTIKLYFGDTLSNECALAASEAVRLVRDEGVRWRDIAVSVSDWSKYHLIAPGIFEKFGVPYYTYDKEDILQKPVLSLITSVLSVIGNGWDYESVFRYLKTDMVNIDIADRDVLENYVYVWNIRGEKMWCRDEDWSFSDKGYEDGRVKEDDAPYLNTVNELRKAVAAPIFRLSEKIKASITVSEMTMALYSFIEDIGLYEKLLGKTDSLRERGENQDAEEYAQLWGILISAMEQCVSVLGDTEIDFEEYSRLFRLLLAQYEVGSIPATLDAVGIGDMTRMRRRNLKHMIILGASDDMLPAFSEASGVLTDLERDELETFGVSLSNTSHNRLHRQISAAFMSITQPSKTLTLSYSTRDGKNRPSFIYTAFSELMDVVPQKISSDISYEAILPCFEYATAGDKLSEAYFNASGVWSKKLSEVKKAASTPRGVLSPASATELYGKNIRLSASRVDKYTGCKFAYFMQYGLQARPREKSTFEAPEAGTFIHFILERVCADVYKGGGFGEFGESELKSLIKKYTKVFIDSQLQGFKDKSKRFIYLFNRIVKDALTVILAMSDELKESDFEPMSFELDFSEGGDISPARVIDENGMMTVNGKVDRVDGWIHGDKLYLRVVDYKTGKKEFSLSDVLNGMGIQMLIYLFVLEKSGRFKDIDMPIVPAGVLYMPARDEIISADRDISDDKIDSERQKLLKRHGLILNDIDVLNAMEHGDNPKYIPVKFTKDGNPSGDSIADLEQFGILSKHIDKLLEDIASGIRGGEISADPYFKNGIDNACYYCDYYEVCRFGDEDADRHRFISKLKTPEVWEKMREEVGRNG